MIPTTTDRPVYLLHHTIPRQLQENVCICLDTQLHQSIIQPSKSQYVSKVVTVCKKSGEIHVCVDYCKKYSITVRNAFPLSQIVQALHAVHRSNCFSSFDLSQAHLHLAMEEDDMKKTAFRARSSGLYGVYLHAFWPVQCRI